MTVATQYACRSLKQFDVTAGAPSFVEIQAFHRDETSIRTFAYSGDGAYLASSSPAGVIVISAESAECVLSLPLKTIIETRLSPRGTFLQTWERPVKPEEGAPPHKNLKVYRVSSGEEVASFTQKAQDGWPVQFTEDETKAVRSVTNEVHIFDGTNLAGGILEKLRIEGVTSVSVSPGLNPSVAVFVAEKKGAPASVKVHSLKQLGFCSSQKTFFKADKVQMKWNKQGTHVLFLTSTDVDKSGKSYYGETNLYMLMANGAFDCRVTLDKEGGIHDFAWSPSSREFSVTFGYMPAKTVIFDTRGNAVHDFGSSPRNFVSYNPQGRLMCIAGFGNLAGQIDIWDRKTLKKVCTFTAPNTSHCEWSPDGRYLMCATLSPRLRVDNGVRIFHYTSVLIHAKMTEELYQATWRPANSDLFPFEGALEAAPQSASGSSTPVKQPAAPSGAYRPPHARGTVTPTLFKREDEGGAAYDPSSTSTFGSSSNGRTSPNFAGRSARRVPGAAPPGMPVEDGEKQSRRKKKGGKERDGTSTPPVEEPAAPAADLAAGAAPLSLEDKKKRAITKKLQAIEQLKVKRDNGDKLELTQVKKLESEGELRKELDALAISK